MIDHLSTRTTYFDKHLFSTTSAISGPYQGCGLRTGQYQDLDLVGIAATIDIRCTLPRDLHAGTYGRTKQLQSSQQKAIVMGARAI